MRFLNFIQSIIKPDTISTVVNIASGNAKPADLLKSFLSSGTPELILSQAINSLNKSGELTQYADKLGKVTELLFAESILLSAPADSPLASAARQAITSWASGEPTPKEWVDYINSLKTAFASITQEAQSTISG